MYENADKEALDTEVFTLDDRDDVFDIDEIEKALGTSLLRIPFQKSRKCKSKSEISWLAKKYKKKINKQKIIQNPLTENNPESRNRK